MACERLDLRLGEGGATRGDRIADACASQAEDVEVALDHEHLVGLVDRAACLVQSVQDPGLVVDRRLGAVDVLGVVVVQRAAPERDHLAAALGDREDEAVAEAVVEAVVALLGDQQTGLLADAGVDACCSQREGEAVPAIRCDPEPMLVGEFEVVAALQQVVAGRLAGRRAQDRIEVLRCDGVGLVEAISAAGPRGILWSHLLLRHGHPGAVGELLDGLRAAVAMKDVPQLVEATRDHEIIAEVASKEKQFQ